MKFSIKDFFSKCDQIRRKLWIWSHLLKKSLMENFIFCAVYGETLKVVFLTSPLLSLNISVLVCERIFAAQEHMSGSHEGPSEISIMEFLAKNVY